MIVLSIDMQLPSRYVLFVRHHENKISKEHQKSALKLASFLFSSQTEKVRKETKYHKD
jgi:hypothetical protein